jgi:hypothetical protein
MEQTMKWFEQGAKSSENRDAGILCLSVLRGARSQCGKHIRETPCSIDGKRLSVMGGKNEGNRRTLKPQTIEVTGAEGHDA